MRPSNLLSGRQVFSALNHAPTQGDWYRMVNLAAEDRAEIWLYDEIGMMGTTAADFVRSLADVKASKIDLHINSKGGDIFDGIAIYNALRTHHAWVNVQVDALAASIASVIAQAGDKRTMITGSQMMIHEAWGLMMGDSADMRAYADMLDKQSDTIAGIYAERSGGSGKKAHYLSLMKATTMLTAKEAVSEGLADEVVKPKATVLEEPGSQDEETVDMAAFLESTEVEGAYI
jgi:ATP-dependent protease ClpP protease subunit